MRLLHYTATPFEFDPAKKYLDDHWKPRGLWVSVEGEHDWKDWCEGESWGLERMHCASKVVLKPNANVLLVDTQDKLDAFNAEFGDNDDSCRSIAWEKVKALYDGVIIAPYQWERRFNYMWYYGWDCASGVIWNLSAIASVEQCVATSTTSKGGSKC